MIYFSIFLDFNCSRCPCNYHYQNIALCFCRLQGMNMSWMNQVKYSTNQNYLQCISSNKSESRVIIFFYKATFCKLLNF